jgi:acyl dehydratase
MITGTDATIEWACGAALPPRTMAVLSRATLALFAGGSGDHNPLHIDSDFARETAGMADVIGHGMLTMALLGRYLTQIVPQQAIRSFSSRFTAMSVVGDAIGCGGTVARLFEEHGRHFAELHLAANRQGDEPLAIGSAIVELDC